MLSAALLVAAGICIGWWFLKQPEWLYQQIGRHRKPQLVMLIVIGVLLIGALVFGLWGTGATEATP